MEERTSRNRLQPFRFWMPSWTSPSGRTRGIAQATTSASRRPTAARKGSQQPCMNVPHNGRPPVQSRPKIKSPSTMREASKAPVQIQPSADKQPRVAQVKSKSNPTSPSSTITLLHKLQAQATSVEKDTKLSSKSSVNPVRRKSNLRHGTVNTREKSEPSQLHNAEDTSKQSLEPNSDSKSTTNSTNVQDSDLKPESINIKTQAASVSSDVNIEQRRSSIEKERKIAISPVSKDSFTDGKRAIYEEEIKEGLSTLKQKITAANSGQGRSNGSSVNVITLAGKNNGASMVIGYDDTKTESLFEDSVEGGSSREVWNHNGETAFSASINNNVQSINNSAIEQSSCSVRHPGVHLKICNRSSETLASGKAMKKPQDTETRRTFAPLQGQMTSQEPRIRRRCLRALFMESSESDIESPPKPRRHGCRFSCEEKRKVKNDDRQTSMTKTGAQASGEGCK